MKTNCRRNHLRHQTVICSVAILVFGYCSTTFGDPPLTPTTTDLWDVHQGTIVTNGSATEAYSRTNNMFGGDSSDLLPGHVEHLNTIFKDFLPQGTVDFVEWQTVSPVTLRSFALFLQHDGPPDHPNTSQERAISEFKLFAFDTATSSFDNLLYDFQPGNPYPTTTAPAGSILQTSGNTLAIEANVPVTTAQRFRADFTQLSTTLGPRVIELDGFTTAVPEPSTFVLAVTAFCTLWYRRKRLQLG